MNPDRIYKILMAPHVTEKSAMAADGVNQVAFRVARDATKPEIRKAVEQLFDVKVEDVRVTNVKGKLRRTRNGIGRRSDWKKAYVRLAQGQEIDFTGAE